MNKFARASITTGALSAALVTVVGLAPSASAAGVSLKNGYGWCLGSKNGADRTVGYLWTCNGNRDQTWTFNYVGEDVLGSFYQIINGNGQCLGTWGGSASQGAKIAVWDCNGNPDQKWYTKGRGNEILNRNSKKCLAGSGSFSGGTTAIQWSCNGNKDQKWH
ncbi:RICIN domain-containing protein [Streptomyces sp. Caat 7-52]|uniref:RICIN domain-containing protein n=1 Tax=Streptomyces sp. Caat 7-52 TaxID=2949637 RepID=UPI002035DC96|nr:RICIN domain-containing protein [Streptomyces sp. Caat 7-52]